MCILGEVITLKMAYGDTTPMRNINGILMALVNSLPSRVLKPTHDGWEAMMPPVPTGLTTPRLT